MAKVDRYYVDADNIDVCSEIVIRDRISPLGKLTYPTDIAVSVTKNMFKSKKAARIVADQICYLLNKPEEIW